MAVLTVSSKRLAASHITYFALARGGRLHTKHTGSPTLCLACSLRGELVASRSALSESLQIGLDEVMALLVPLREGIAGVQEAFAAAAQVCVCVGNGEMERVW